MKASFAAQFTGVALFAQETTKCLVRQLTAYASQVTGHHGP